MRTRVVDEPSYTHTHPPEKKEKKKIDRSIQVSLNLKLGSPKETKKRSTGWKANILTIVLQAFFSSLRRESRRSRQDGSCGSLTCRRYIVFGTIYARRESNSDPLLSSCVGEDAFGRGDFSKHNLPLCEIYTPSVTKGTHAKPKKRRPRATDTARPSDPARARARGAVPTSLRRRRQHHHLPLSPFAPRRSKRKGKRKRERQPTSRRVWKERLFNFN